MHWHLNLSEFHSFHTSQGSRGLIHRSTACNAQSKPKPSTATMSASGCLQRTPLSTESATSVQTCHASQHFAHLLHSAFCNACMQPSAQNIHCTNPDQPSSAASQRRWAVIRCVADSTADFQPSSDGTQPKRNRLQPNCDGLQPNSDGIQPNSDGLRPRAMASNLIAMAHNLRAMASNLLAMASNLLAMASNLIAMASNPIAMAYNPIAMASDLELWPPT